MKIHKKEVCCDEDDIPTQEQAEKQSTWVPCQNAYAGRKKSFSSQKSKRKKSIISIRPRFVAFVFLR